MGDSEHDGSSGATAYMSAAFPSDCDIFDGCAATDIDVNKALDLVKSLGPINVSCGSPSASASRLIAVPAGFKLSLPPIPGCSAGFNGLANVLADVNAKIGEGLSATDFKGLFDDLLPVLGPDKPKTAGGLFGNLGGILGPVVRGTGLGKIFSELPVGVIGSKIFQAGAIEAMFKNVLTGPLPTFPTPVKGQGSKAKKKGFLVASGKFQVASGATKKVRLKLSKKARKFFGALRKHGVGLDFTVTLQGTLVRGGVPGAAAGKQKVRVHVKPPKSKGKRR